jgi:hypothetical protein
MVDSAVARAKQGQDLLVERGQVQHEHLRAEQQQADWAMIDAMRVSLARDRRRQRTLGALVLIGVAADAVLMYVVLHVLE